MGLNYYLPILTCHCTLFHPTELVKWIRAWRRISGLFPYIGEYGYNRSTSTTRWVRLILDVQLSRQAQRFGQSYPIRVMNSCTGTFPSSYNPILTHWIQNLFCFRLSLGQGLWQWCMSSSRSALILIADKSRSSSYRKLPLLFVYFHSLL